MRSFTTNLISRAPSGRKLLFLLALSAYAASPSAQTFECANSQGRIRYSALPCEPHETARDMRKIRKKDNRTALSHDSYVQQEREHKEKEALARTEEELRREQELIKLERELRYEEATARLEKLRAEKEARTATR